MLYQQIERNKRKTILLMLLFSIVVLALGWAAGYLLAGDYYSGIFITLLILAVYLPITYFTANRQVLRMSGAREISKEDNPMLYNIVDELALVARIPMPKIYIVHDPSPNAFATGTRPENGVVAFTTGILEKLNREELEGVAAHEIAHIRNYDIRLMTVCIALVGVIAIVAEFGLRMLQFGGGKSRGNSNRKTHPALLVVALVLIILAPIVAQFVHFAVSRNREYLADASAVEFTRNPVGLKHALLKISQSPEEVRQAKGATAAMYIANPFRKRKKKSSLLATHPPIEERIKRLERM